MSGQFFTKKFGGFKQKPYFCNVFFIVLDLRLTIRLAAASHFLCPYLSEIIPLIGIIFIE